MEQLYLIKSVGSKNGRIRNIKPVGTSLLGTRIAVHKTEVGL